MNNFSLLPKKTFVSSSADVLTLATVVAVAATAVWVEVQTRRAKRENPPSGWFLDVDGVRLHYVERGDGPPVVLLHGNAVTYADFEASGLIDRLARNHRVIAFDRPGFGHSSRPRDRLWTPAAQAALLRAALQRLGLERWVLVGHSMGTLVALAMALDFPANVAELVLIGGYYYPCLRVDALMTAPVALPVVGDVMRYTVTALSGRAMLKGLLKGMFSPQEVPVNFLPMLHREVLLRPVQLRANAEDAAFMIPAAFANSRRYGELKLPVMLVAGAEDKVIDQENHLARLHRELPESQMHIVAGTGHMAHYKAQDIIVKAVEGQSLIVGSGSHIAQAAIAA